MNRHRLFLFTILLMALSWPHSLYAYDFSSVAPTGQTLYYNIVSGGVEVTYPGSSLWSGYTEPTGDLTIPATITYNGATYSVTSIGDYAFRDCTSLASVNIPNSVTSIGYAAFYYCTSLASVNIPNSVTSIGNYAFCGCTSLASVNIPNSVTSIGYAAFYNCTSLASVNIPNSVTSIGNSAFQDCTSLASVNIPNSVTSIGNSAFSGCTSLASVNIPNSVTSIGNSAFANCTSLDSVNIPNSVTSIGNFAFYNCTSLASVNIPNSVTSIGSAAFEYCTSLASVNIPNSVTSIGSSAFANCTSLASVIIPNSVTSIGSAAFAYCTSLASVNIPNSVTSIGNSAFYDCTSLASVNIPNSVTSIGDNAFYNCTSLASVNIPNSVTSIGDSAFAYCRSLASVNIPNSVTSIGNSAFRVCTSLASVNIPNSVTSIGNSAFIVCRRLASVNIPNSVTSIGDSAFFFTNLNHISLHNVNPPSLGTNPFGGVPSTCTITVPCGRDSVYRASEWGNVFSNIAADCIIYDFWAVAPSGDTLYYKINFDSLSVSVVNPGGIIWGSHTMPSDALVIPATVTHDGTDYSVTAIGDMAFFRCRDLTVVTIPNSVNHIGGSAFGTCQGLTSVTIPNSITTIEFATFEGCDSLTSVTIPNSVTFIDGSAFGNCINLNRITVLDTNPPLILTNPFNGVPDTCTITVPCGRDSVYRASEWGRWFSNIIGYCPYDFWAIAPSHDTIYYKIIDSISVMVVSPFVPDTTGLPNLDSIALSENMQNHINVFANHETEIPQFTPDTEMPRLQTMSPNGTIIPETVAHNGISYSVARIADYAFYRCRDIVSVTIPDNVVSIGRWAFAFDSILGSVTLGSSIRDIGYGAFYGCISLTNLVLPSPGPSDPSDPCNNCGTSIVLGDHAFYGWGRGNLTPILITLTIPRSVIYIGDNAFAESPCIATVNYHADSCTYMGSTAAPVFENDINFHTLNIGNTVKVIPANAFYGCSGFNVLTIPSSVKTIESNAFHGCSGIDTLTIPASVSTINSSAFAGCSGLTRITAKRTVAPTTSANAFDGIPIDIPVYIPCGSLASYSTSWSHFTNFVEEMNVNISVLSADATMGSAIVVTQPTCASPIATVTATPNSGYIFTNWTENGSVVSTSSSYSFTASANRTLTANFIQDTFQSYYSISALTNPTEGGTVSGTGDYFIGNTCTLVATPEPGYVFLNWTECDTMVSTNSTYSFTVTADRTLTADFSLCGFGVKDLPYSDNFDHYTSITTAKTGVEPSCWTQVHQDVRMTDEYKPMIYHNNSCAHSGSYSLILNKRGIYAMPEFEGDVNMLQLSFYLKQTAAKYQLQVGVVSSLNNANTFVPIATVDNSSTEIEYVEVDLSSYTGDGHYIAFRNILADGYAGDYSCNYIDDLIVSAAPCTSISVSDLPYTDNFDHYTTSTTAKTGVEPTCWTLAHQDVSMADEYKPMIYYSSVSRSGYYSLILNKRGIYAMPAVDTNIRSLQLSFYLRQQQTRYQLIVGVMDNLSDASTFVPVDTINNRGTGYELVEVDFSSYTGNGHYIAFRNILAPGQTSDYSCNYIDDLTLEIRQCNISMDSLPYIYNFDNYTTSTTAKTGVEPDCWRLVHQYVNMADQYKPMIYYDSSNAHSGNYSLILNKRCIYAMPKIEGEITNTLIYISVKQPQTKYQLEVGIMSDLNDISTFESFGIIDNTSTNYEFWMIDDLMNYSGQGKYIAFRNLLAPGFSGDYSVNYIDDIMIKPLTYCTVSALVNPTAGGTVSGAKDYIWATSCTLIATPKPNYTFVNWTVNDSIISTDATISFSVYNDITVTANFIRSTPPTYTIAATANPTAGGTVTGAGNYTSGSSCTLAATPAAGYAFENWTSGSAVVSTNATYTFTVTGNRTLTANFAPVANCGISVDDLPYTDNFDHYTTSTTAKTGVEPDCWTLAHQDVSMADEYKPMVYYSSANAHSGNYSLILNKRGIYAMPEYSGDVSALQLSFYLKQTAAKYQLQVGVMSSLDNAGTFVPVATLNNSSTSASVQQTVSFANYSGNGHYIAFRNILASGQTGDFSCNYVDDLRLEVRPQPVVYSVTASANPAAGGTVTGAGSYTNGSSCTLRATPATNYTFVNWASGNTVVSTNATYTFTVTGNRTLTANFSYTPPTYTVTASTNPAAGGTVTGAGSYTSGTSCTLRATPATGYTFVNWTTGSTVVSTNATYTFTVTANRSLTANFAPVVNCGIAIADLPYTDNFDHYTTSTTAKTGVEPTCWTLAHQYVSMTDEYKPMVYYNAASAHSGNYSLILNKRSIYAMPEFEGEVSTLQLSFYLRQSAAKYQLQVGVMSDLDNAGTFVPVATLNNSSTTAVVQHTVDFASYTGNGHYIAFKNTLASGQTGDYSCNYIDEITLDIRPQQCGISVDDLPYTDNFDSYTTSTTAKTGVEPDCWTLAHQDVSMADEYKPMVYYSSANAHSGNYSLILNKRGIYAMPEFDGEVSSLQLSFYLKQTAAKYQLQVGVMSSLDNAGTFVPVATLNNSSTSASVQQTVSFANYSGNGHYIAFRNILASGQTGDFSCNYVDDLRLEVRPQPVVYSVTASANPTAGGTVTGAGSYTSGSTCTLRATPATGYTFVNWTSGSTVVSTNATYTFTVTANRSLTANFVPVVNCGIAIADLPYTENFDSHTSSTTAYTGVEPPCWTLALQEVTMGNADKPMIYYGSSNAHSGSYSLILNKRGIYAMPEFEGNIDELVMGFYVMQTRASYRLTVGVMSDLSNPSTFTPVATANNSSTTGFSYHEVDFSTYEGDGKYIVFRNTNSAISNYSVNYIDDITLRRIAPPCEITIADLPYSDNFDSYTTSTTAKTGVEPTCWTLALQEVTMTDEYKPMVYYGSSTAHSGSYSLILNKRGIYAMPAYNGDISSLQLSFYLKQTRSTYELTVGVMDDLDDPETFEPVASFNNSSTDYVSQTVDFSNYSGTGNYIVFRNTNNAISDYSVNYIDDITLTTRANGCDIQMSELPYTENFDTYTTTTTAKTGVEPTCWTLVHQDVAMTDEYKPMVYYGSSTSHSGNYSLILNKRGIYAMPAVVANVNSLQMELYVRQTQAKYQLQVGVMSDLSDHSTFVPVSTLNNSSTTATQHHLVNFSSYTGSGRYIAFRNTLASGQTGDYSCNYIDDINLSVAASTVAKGSGDEDGYTSGGHRLTLYPNPTTGKLTVEADDEVARVDVFDYTGRCVATYQGQTTLDLGHLAAGLYTLRLTLPDRIEVRRVVKQ